MSSALSLAPVLAAPAVETAAQVRELEVRARVAHLFRKRGDSAAMRTLEQALLTYRLEQPQ